ncbi:MAG: hypothetical protein SYNGOMJ08_00872 [Candidatus Syntrophoarchaeum sp. GoM_oil]|nr:MAG: hypothetical protein SYNGOMJ08_00872 [Candidatus Syntrophoarchaeum sp. GoM_oil]
MMELADKRRRLWGTFQSDKIFIHRDIYAKYCGYKLS